MGTVPQSISTGGDVPVHVAIIMDGNGRWANVRGKNRTMGHRAGAEAVRRTIEAATELGIKYLTLFSFSSENWSRPESEVNDLMGLLRLYLRKETSELHKQGIRIRVIGDRGRLAKDIRASIDHAEQLTRDNDRLTVVLALSYGSRGEITGAVKRIAARVQSGELQLDDIDETLVDSFLLTDGIPDPDLLIRTSGEQRISNFLLWQLAYTEFVFLDKYWPDFGADDLADAMRDFARRERRFGTSHG